MRKRQAVNLELTVRTRAVQVARDRATGVEPFSLVREAQLREHVATVVVAAKEGDAHTEVGLQGVDFVAVDVEIETVESTLRKRVLVQVVVADRHHRLHEHVLLHRHVVGGFEKGRHVVCVGV